MTSPTRFNRIDVDKEITAGSIGSADDPIEATAESVSNVQYANLKSGATLDVRVQQALDDLAGGQGLVIAPGPVDGTTPVWADTLSVNPADYNGIELRFFGEITDTSSGWTFDIDAGGDIDSQLNGSSFELRGGFFIGDTATDPTGFIRSRDLVNAKYETRAKGYRNSASDSTAFFAQNNQNFSEGVDVDLHLQTVDRAFDSEDAGGGSSFQDWKVRLVAGSIRDFGVRLNANWTSSSFDTDIRLGADDSRGYVINGNVTGVVFISPEIENPSGSTGTIGWDLQTDAVDSPIVIGGEINSGGAAVDTPVRRSEDIDALYRIAVDDRAAIELEDIGRTKMRLQRNGNLEVYAKANSDGTAGNTQTMALLSDGTLRTSGAQQENYTF